VSHIHILYRQFLQVLRCGATSIELMVNVGIPASLIRAPVPNLDDSLCKPCRHLNLFLLCRRRHALYVLHDIGVKHGIDLLRIAFIDRKISVFHVRMLQPRHAVLAAQSGGL
jgi:hypothetical protein